MAKDVKIDFRVDTEFKQQMQNEADSRGVTLGNLVRWYLEEEYQKKTTPEIDDIVARKRTDRELTKMSVHLTELSEKFDELRSFMTNLAQEPEKRRIEAERKKRKEEIRRRVKGDVFLKQGNGELKFKSKEEREQFIEKRFQEALSRSKIAEKK